MKKSKRQGFSWDAEFKPFVDTLKGELKGFSAGGEEPTSVEMFMLCLAIGFSSGTRRETPVRKTDGPRLSYFQADQMALIRAVALAESDSSEILVDEESIYDLAEQFAAGGLMLLANGHETNANFRDWLRSKLADYSRLEKSV